MCINALLKQTHKNETPKKSYGDAPLLHGLRNFFLDSLLHVRLHKLTPKTPLRRGYILLKEVTHLLLSLPRDTRAQKFDFQMMV